MSEPFRTTKAPDALASFPSVSKGQTETIAKSNGVPGLYTYESVKGSPYTADYFKLKQFWDSPTSEMQDKIKTLDQYIQKLAKKRGLEDKPESYSEIVDEILKQIGKSENEQSLRTFERVSKAAEAIQRLEEAKLPPVLDVNSLTPDEYKETRIE